MRMQRILVSVLIMTAKVSGVLLRLRHSSEVLAAAPILAKGHYTFWRPARVAGRYWEHYCRNCWLISIARKANLLKAKAKLLGAGTLESAAIEFLLISILLKPQFFAGGAEA